MANKSTLLYSCLALMLSVGTISCQRQQKGPAKIEFETLSHDFGMVNADSMVCCDFHFKNSGGQELVIDDVLPDCHCTKISLPTSYLQPGEESVIHVAFDGSHFMTGQQDKTILVRTNDADNPETELTFTAYIIHR